MSSSQASEIIQSLIATLRDAGLFAEVVAGDAGVSTAVPRATVVYEGHDVFLSDDSGGNVWVRLRARVTVHARNDASVRASSRVMDLCSAAAEALLEDPFRGQRCRDLPIGQATEASHCDTLAGLRSPECEASLSVRCHFEMEDVR